MKPGSITWWAAKIRQARRHFGARVSTPERDSVAAWLSPEQLALFDSMHVADRRHGLDVVAALRAGGDTDPELLLAGLIHDAGKGDTGFLPRVMSVSLVRLGDHAESSARLAEAAGCAPRTVELIRWQDEPRDPVAGERLRLADEAN